MEKEKYIIHESGEPNHFTVLKDKKWFAVIQFNGELTMPKQREIINKWVNKIN